MPAPVGETVLSYDGATTIGLHLLPDLVPLLARAGLRFGAVDGRGTNAGLEAARRREVDVAGVLRQLTAAEKAELRWELVGHDALGVFVTNANPVRGLTRAQIEGIFTGKVGSWRELGGADVPVVPVTEVKTGGRGTVQELRRIALRGAEYGPTVEYEDAPDCLLHVARDPGAVTAASMSMAIPGVRALAIDGVPSDGAGVRSGAYLLGRPMYLVAAKPAAPAVEALLAVMRSREVQAVVARRFTPAV
jgi:phosphate transport system substrate-binding protein